MKRILSLTASFWRYRDLLLQMTKQEIQGRFAGSFGGLMWSVGHPLISFLVYLLVFVHILKMRAPQYGGDSGFALYLMAGLFPWMAFAEGFQRSATAVLQSAQLIKRSVFPSEILIGKSVLGGFVANGIAMVILLCFVAFTRGNLAALVLVPILAAVQVVYTIGFGFLAAAISPFFRDVVQVIDVAVRFWIFLMPVFYPLSVLPEIGQKLLWLNPFYPLLVLYQDAYLVGRLGSPVAVAALLGWTILFYGVGGYVFSKLKDEFADWV